MELHWEYNSLSAFKHRKIILVKFTAIPILKMSLGYSVYEAIVLQLTKSRQKNH